MREPVAMSIRVRCACGKALVAPESAAGKRLKCPGCAQPVLVPEADLLSEEPPTPTRGAARQPRTCHACHAELLGNSTLCIACGWDTDRKARLCPQCRCAYRVSSSTGYTYSAGVVALSVGVKAAFFGFAGGILGDVAWALAVCAVLGVLNCLSGLTTTGYACPMCHRFPKGLRLSKEEAKAPARQRTQFGVGLAACVVVLVLMVGWYRSLARKEPGAAGAITQAVNSIGEASARADSMTCADNMKSLCVAIVLYLDAHERRYPDALEDLDLRHQRSFEGVTPHCPLTTDGASPYVYFPADDAEFWGDGKELLLCDSKPHADGRRCFARVSGAIEILDNAAVLEQARMRGRRTLPLIEERLAETKRLLAEATDRAELDRRIRALEATRQGVASLME